MPPGSALAPICITPVCHLDYHHDKLIVVDLVKNATDTLPNTVALLA